MPDHRAAVYQQLCENYRAIDDFRTKLLGLLPFATAAGAGILLNDKIGASGAGDGRAFLGAIGSFGFLATIGLFSYELHGIKKCGWLIRTGAGLERSLGIRGPFSTRPQHFLGLVDEPFAASVIYPATLAAWAFVALAVTSAWAAAAFAAIVFVAAFRWSLRLIRLVEDDIDAGTEYKSEPSDWRDALRPWPTHSEEEEEEEEVTAEHEQPSRTRASPPGESPPAPTAL
jgi:hypothetical protein